METNGRELFATISDTQDLQMSNFMVVSIQRDRFSTSLIILVMESAPTLHSSEVPSFGFMTLPRWICRHPVLFLFGGSAGKREIGLTVGLALTTFSFSSQGKEFHFLI